MKPTEKEINIALNIVDALCAEGLRNELVYSGHCIWAENEGEKILKDMGIRYNYGATKFVLVCEDLENWVIKLSYEVSESFIEETGIFNFCEREAENYEAACKKGLEQFFAATYKVGIVQDVNVYLQERVDPDNELFYAYFEEYVDERYSECDREAENYWNMVEEDIYDLGDEERLEAIFRQDYTVEEIRELIEFCEDYDINDLHECNYGVTPDKRNVIIDFSGYSC